jgi:hypothetical protein
MRGYCTCAFAPLTLAVSRGGSTHTPITLAEPSFVRTSITAVIRKDVILFMMMVFSQETCGVAH